jgi:hypothetical protein
MPFADIETHHFHMFLPWIRSRCLDPNVKETENLGAISRVQALSNWLPHSTTPPPKYFSSFAGSQAVAENNRMEATIL